MELPGGRSDVASLTQLGAEAARLIKEQNYRMLAERFGYALAHDVEPADAIQADVDACLARGWAAPRSLMSCSPTIAVKYFEPSEIGFFAEIECTLPLAHKAGRLLAELIVTTTGSGMRVFLEQIRYAP